LGQKIDQCKTHWEHYGQAASKAYAAAWHSQDKVLTQVKKRIEERMEAERAVMSFALSLVTVGVAGPLAGAAVKTLIAKAGIDMTQDEIKEAVKWAEEKVKEPTQKGTEWLVKRFEPPPDEEVFKPAGISPDEYGPQLLEGIEAQVGILQDLLVGLRESKRVTLHGAKALTENIVDRTFVRDMPALEITSDLLTPKAGLALWMGWAWTAARDVDYRMDFQYANDMTPILDLALRPLGVPINLVSGTYSTDRSGRQKKTVINMQGFVQWAKNPMASELLFRGLPKNAEGFKQVQTQLQTRTYARQSMKGGS
jgi:DNA-binding protein YbaB